MGSKGLQGEEAHSVRWYRLNAGLTIDEVAARAGIAVGTVVRLERGERSTLLDHEAERRVARALGVEVEAIAFGARLEANGVATINLGTLRAESGLEPAQVATGSGVPRRTVVRAEAGVPVHPRYAKALADYWKIKVTDFYPRERRAAA